MIRLVPALNPQFPADAKWLFAVNLAYPTGLSIIKMSVLLFYIRVFQTVKAYRSAFWSVGFLIVAWCVAFSFLAIFRCVPVQKLWNHELEGNCIPIHAVLLSTTVSNIIIDAIILLLPMPMLWRLRVNVVRKWALIAVFTAGYW